MLLKSTTQEQTRAHHHKIGNIPYKYLVNFKVVTMAGYVKKYETDHPFYITPQGVIYQLWTNPESTRFCYKHIYRPRHVLDGGIDMIQWYNLLYECGTPRKHIKNFFARHYNIDVNTLINDYCRALKWSAGIN